MRNPIRRNKNIGTAKQGRGQNNKLVIPWSDPGFKSFNESLTSYTKETRDINGTRFEFVIEQTREDTAHACTVNDIAEICDIFLPKIMED